MQKTRMLPVTMLALAPWLLTGCLDNADAPDAGDRNAVQISGTVVDGYVAGARVFVDLNHNGQRDAFEPRATTDAFGYFSYRPELNIEGEIIPARDYCREGPARHCLRVNTDSDVVTVRAEGGHDLLTGRPFRGALTRRVQLSLSDSTDMQAITPLTTLEHAPSTASGDYWDDYQTGTGTFDAEDALHAWALHAMFDWLAGRAIEGANEDRSALIEQYYDALRQDADVFVESILDDEETDFFDFLTDPLNAPEAVNMLETFRKKASEAIAQEDNSDRDTIATQIRAFTAALVALKEEDEDNVNDIMDRLDLDEMEKRDESGQQEVDLDTWGLLLRLEDSTLNHQEDSRIELASFASPFHDADTPDNNLPAGKKLVINEDAENGGMSVSLFFDVPGDEDFRGSLALCITGADQSQEVDFGDFGDGEDLFISGEWARPNNRQLILTLSALGGALEETASLAPRGQGEDLLALNGNGFGDDELFRLDYQDSRGAFLAEETFTKSDDFPTSLDECNGTE